MDILTKILVRKYNFTITDLHSEKNFVLYKIQELEKLITKYWLWIEDKVAGLSGS